MEMIASSTSVRCSRQTTRPVTPAPPGRAHVTRPLTAHAKATFTNVDSLSKMSNLASATDLSLAFPSCASQLSMFSVCSIVAFWEKLDSTGALMGASMSNSLLINDTNVKSVRLTSGEGDCYKTAKGNYTNIMYIIQNP